MVNKLLRVGSKLTGIILMAFIDYFLMMRLGKGFRVMEKITQEQFIKTETIMLENIKITKSMVKVNVFMLMAE